MAKAKKKEEEAKEGERRKEERKKGKLKVQYTFLALLDWCILSLFNEI